MSARDRLSNFTLLQLNYVCGLQKRFWCYQARKHLPGRERLQLLPQSIWALTGFNVVQWIYYINMCLGNGQAIDRSSEIDFLTLTAGFHPGSHY